MISKLDHVLNLPDERFDATSTSIHLVKRNFADDLGTVISANEPWVSDRQALTRTLSN